MNKQLLSLTTLAGLLLAPAASHAAPVEYVRVCSAYGAGFHYIPGTDTCVNSNGDTRQATEGGVWRSLTPYPEGRWVTSPQQECQAGRLVALGTFTAQDFTQNPWNRMQTRGVPVSMQRNEFVSKVIFSGGFSDPRLSNRSGTNLTGGLCVRSTDPGKTQPLPGGGTVDVPFGNNMLPIGCVANSRILGMPAAYAVDATAAYPSIESYYLDAGQTSIAGPFTYGSRLVVTTDFGSGSLQLLSYTDARTATIKPLGGSVSVAVCVQQGSGSEPGGPGSPNGPGRGR